MSRTLSAPVTVSFDYTRSVGPVLGRFLTGLREQRIVGARLSDGRVVVPPPEFDPTTHQAVGDFVDLPDTGVVTSWTWVSEPVAGQPFDRPFAFALITIDGADAAWLHAVDVSSPDAITTGMRVRARWAEERTGLITDLVFEPEPESAPVSTSSTSEDAGVSTSSTSEDAGVSTSSTSEDARVSTSSTSEDARVSTSSTSEDARVSTSSTSEDAGISTSSTSEHAGASTGSTSEDARVSTGSTSEVTGIVTPVSLDYTYAASPEESAFFRGLAEGRILGQRCPVCRKVYVPPRAACPVDGVPTEEEIELSDTGTVTTFCIVNVPFLGQKITPPYVSAYILLDGADIALQHLILDIPTDEVRMGLRVKAVWKPRDEWGTSIENISHFAPTGEPDADFDSYKHHL